MQPTSHGAMLRWEHENAQTVSHMEEPMENYGEMRQTIGHHTPQFASY